MQIPEATNALARAKQEEIARASEAARHGHQVRPVHPSPTTRLLARVRRLVARTPRPPRRRMPAAPPEPAATLTRALRAVGRPWPAAAWTEAARAEAADHDERAATAPCS